MLAFDGTGVEGLRASGRAEVNAEQVVIPVNARAARITGLNAAAGGILRNVRVSGDFAYAAGRLISDNLKIDSDRMNATAVVLADRSEEHTSELQSLMRSSYAVFCLKKKY